MKKISVLSILLFVLLFSYSCNKEKVDLPLGTIRVEINGTKYTFSVQSKATNLSVTGGNGIQIQGRYKETSTTDLTLIIARPGPISVGTYTENAASNPLVTITHCTEVLVPCVFRAVSFGSPSNPVSVTIAEITSSSVKGTFKGDLQTSAGNTETLSKGEFYVSF